LLQVREDEEKYTFSNSINELVKDKVTEYVYNNENKMTEDKEFSACFATQNSWSFPGSGLKRGLLFLSYKRIHKYPLWAFVSVFRAF